jgi:hypothetical protein
MKKIFYIILTKILEYLTVEALLRVFAWLKKLTAREVKKKINESVDSAMNETDPLKRAQKFEENWSNMQ